MQFKKKNFLNVALVVTAIFTTFVLLEIVLRITHLATDLALVEGDEELGFKFVPNQTGTFVIGPLGEIKSKFHINKNSWKAARDYNQPRDQENTRIAVIGDSYIEALQVPMNSAMPALLEEGMLRRYAPNEFEVYSFGISGASLSHYLAFMRYVRRNFSPDLYIVNVVHNDFQDSLTTPGRAIFHSVRPSANTFEEVRPERYQPSSIRRLARESAVVRYLAVNLKVWEKLSLLFHTFHQDDKADRQFEANINVSAMDVKKMKRVVRYIFEKYLIEVDGDRRKLLIVIDASRKPIYEGIHPKATRAFQFNELTAEVCQNLLLYCLDLTEAFWQDFQKNNQRFNSEIDGHWNKYGHSLVARQVQDFLHEHGLHRVTDALR